MSLKRGIKSMKNTRLWNTFSYGKNIKEPFLINAPKGLPSRLLKRLMKQGLTPKEAFKKAWKLKKRGITNPVSDLMIVNPKRKRGGKKMRRKRKSGTHRLTVRGRKGSLRVSRKSRLAPSFARRGALINPLSGFALNRRKRRTYRRNAPLTLPLIGRIDTRTVIPEVLGLSGGFIAVKSLPQMIFPINWQVGIMGYASKGITAIVLSMVAKRVVGSRVAKYVLYGGLTAIATELIGQLMVKVGLPVGLYLTPQDMSYYMQPSELQR